MPVKTLKLKAELNAFQLGKNDPREGLEVTPIGSMHNNRTGQQIQIAATTTGQTPRLVLIRKDDAAIMIDIDPLLEAAARQLIFA